jgi:ABC-type multidrug transport system ATPase subunit
MMAVADKDDDNDDDDDDDDDDALPQEILKLLELEDVGDRIIGEGSDDGLLMGARKRVTIGVELVANPSVIFLGAPHANPGSYCGTYIGST